MSKLLERFKAANPDMVDKFWSEGEDGWWVDLKSPYDWEGCSCVHEYTVADCLRVLKNEVRKLPQKEYNDCHGITT